MSTCQNITGAQQKKVLPIHPSAAPAPPVLSILGRGKWQANGRFDSLVTPHPGVHKTTGEKKEAGRSGRPAHLTHNRAWSWVGLKADSSPQTAPPRLPARKSGKERGWSWSVIVLLDFYQDVLGLGVEHLVKCFKPIILTVYRWRINTQIPQANSR